MNKNTKKLNILDTVKNILSKAGIMEKFANAKRGK